MRSTNLFGKESKKSLKAYLDVVKKGPKGKGRNDPELDSWVEANTPRYMIGRSSKTNPRLELGQWYTIFKALVPSVEILEHPCKKFSKLRFFSLTLHIVCEYC